MRKLLDVSAIALHSGLGCYSDVRPPERASVPFKPGKCSAARHDRNLTDRWDPWTFAGRAIPNSPPDLPLGQGAHSPIRLNALTPQRTLFAFGSISSSAP
jgi:hypothetical protein